MHRRTHGTTKMLCLQHSDAGHGGRRLASTSTTLVALYILPHASQTWQQTGMHIRRQSLALGPWLSSGVHHGWAPLCCTIIRVKGGVAQQGNPSSVSSVHRRGILRFSQVIIFCRSTPSALTFLGGLGQGGGQGQGLGGGQGFGGGQGQGPVSYTHLTLPTT